MAVKKTTKAREVQYWIPPTSGTTPVAVLQVREWSPPPVTRPEEDETCHEDASAQTTLGTPKAGPATITILADLTSAVHKRIRDLALTASDPIWIAKGYDDGTAAPDSADLEDGFVFPTTRSFIAVQGTVTNWREAAPIGQNTTWQFDFVPTGLPVVSNKA